MATFTAFLRGINVSGKNTVKMTELKSLCAELGFEEIHHYLQSGNLVLKSAGSDPTEIASTLLHGIKKAFGFEVAVFVFLPRDLAITIRENPFLKEKGITEETLHVTFLEKAPSRERLSLLPNASGSDRIQVVKTRIYLHCPQGYGRSKLNNNALEKVLGVAATTRNWRTVKAVYTMVEKCA